MLDVEGDYQVVDGGHDLRHPLCHGHHRPHLLERLVFHGRRHSLARSLQTHSLSLSPSLSPFLPLEGNFFPPAHSLSLFLSLALPRVSFDIACVSCERDWYFIVIQPAPAPHLAHPEGRAAPRIVLLLCPVSAALASIFRVDSISTSYPTYFGLWRFGLEIQEVWGQVFGSEGWSLGSGGLKIQGLGFRIQRSGLRI